MKLTIIHNPFEPDNKKIIYGDNLDLMIRSEFKSFPSNAKIYKKQWFIGNDITQEFILNHDIANDYDEFVLVIEPSLGIFEIVAIVSAIVSTALSLYVMFTMPKPNPLALESSNNSLANRTNEARLGGREPEIFGEVRSYPDLIAPVFNYYDTDDREIEEAFLCITRGYVDVLDMREDATNVEDIDGISVSVYNPSTPINGIPIFQVGDEFTEPLLAVEKSKSINGQELVQPNEQEIESSKITFKYPNIIKLNDLDIDLTTMFATGESIAIYGANFGAESTFIVGNAIIKTTEVIEITSSTNVNDVSVFESIVLSNALVDVTTEILPIPPATIPTYQTKYYDLSGRYAVSSITKVASGANWLYTITISNAELVNPNWQYLDVDKNASVNVAFANNVNTIDLDDKYEISAVSSQEITLLNPELVNEDWLKLDSLVNDETLPLADGIRLDKITSGKWVGWFNLEKDDTEQLIFNVFFPNGLFYQDSKGGVWEDTMTVQVQYQMIDSSNVPYGDIETELFVVTKSKRSSFGRTLRVDLSEIGRVRFRIARTTPTKNDKTQDLCKIKDVYGASVSTKLTYPNVTTLRVKTPATESALSLKERKINCLVIRRLPLNGTGALTATKSGAQALIYLALDDKNGRRRLSEVDVAEILAVEQEVINYFDDEKATEFSYTIDDANLSFEEISGMITSTMFCDDYRYGSKIRIKADKPQTIPVMIFSSSNKVPDSEKRTGIFVTRPNFYGKGYDGVELEYTSPDDDTRINYIASDLSSPINPMKIKTSGIRTHEQAKTRAWREYNKMKYQRENVEFTALEESTLLARNDMILVSDSTMIETQSGYILEIDGNDVYLSQDAKAGNYTLYMQIPDMTVDSIDCVITEDSNKASLLRAPQISIASDVTSYILIPESQEEVEAYLVSELNVADEQTNVVIATNYDNRYYSKDLEFFGS